MNTDTVFETSVKITLEPIGNPEVKITVGNDSIQTVLIQEQTFSFNNNSTIGTLSITVEMLNKSDSDSITAVIVKTLTFNQISDPKFVWKGTYFPKYPEPWASQQNNLKHQLVSHNYLGWNGIWKLEVEIPIFTWMHQVLNLGWIYE